ncbi:hypothetical protein SH528x_002433 [Novipirellula sp. SH528]|uniref:hypothetical protein n=1 Tax=Novipirellula sp. SH528 TaxID=3454466 RepID=UPI003F9FD2EB
MRLSPLFCLSVIGGCSGFFASQLVASQAPSSFIAITVDRLGVLYGTLLFATGLYAMLVTSKEFLSNTIDGSDSRALWIIGLPVLVGMVGVFHGYVGLATHYSSLPQEIAIPHATVWATAMVGAFFTMASATMLLIGRRMHQAPRPLAR